MCTIERFCAVAALMGRLGELLAIPEGHRYNFDRENAERWVVGHNERFGSDMSAFVSRAPYDETDESQIHVEVRVFVDEPRAILWVKQGRPIAFQARSLFAENSKDPFVYAEDYEGLFREIVSRVNRALNQAHDCKQVA